MEVHSLMRSEVQPMAEGVSTGVHRANGHLPLQPRVEGSAEGQMASLEETGYSDLHPQHPAFAPGLSASCLPCYTVPGSCNQRPQSLLHPSPPSQGVQCCGSQCPGCGSAASQVSLAEGDVQCMLNQLYGRPLKMQASAHDGWRTSRCSADHLRCVANLQEPHTGIVRPVMPRTP